MHFKVHSKACSRGVQNSEDIKINADILLLRVAPSQAKLANRVGKGSAVYLAAVMEVRQSVSLPVVVVLMVVVHGLLLMLSPHLLLRGTCAAACCR